MTPERWKRIEALFDSAVELAPEERVPFLKAVCAGDPELYGQVMSLLAADERPTSLLDQPVLEPETPTQTEEQPDELTGGLLGHYHIGRLLGSGGMGQVYLAEDTELHRAVAVKLLHSRFTRETERVRRFKREAHAASALNHPCILHVYEVGSEEDRHFIVTEFVEGVTLRERLKSGPLTVAEALHIAVQLSKAVGAAHQAGLVHRDIKPENIMVRPDGYIKVLDFGIVKLLEDAKLEGRETLAHTETGTVIGTVRYMSPEQARGLAVDARTDLWSIGVVLYEMLAGRVPFDGATLGLIWGGLFRLWMRLVADRPQFSVWATAYILGASMFVGASAGLAFCVRRRGAGRRAGIARTLAVCSFITLGAGPGVIVVPTVLFSTLALVRKSWPTWARLCMAALGVAGFCLVAKIMLHYWPPLKAAAYLSLYLLSLYLMMAAMRVGLAPRQAEDVQTEARPELRSAHASLVRTS